MRFRHALVVLLAAASLALVAATPATGALDMSASATSSAEASAAGGIDAAGNGIVAMTSGAVRTGSAVMVGPGLWMTSTHVVGTDPHVQNAIMTVSGTFYTFKEISRDKALGIVLLGADVPDAKPLPWGEGRKLIADDKVVALGIGSGNRELLPQTGVVKSPAASFGSDLMLTDIKMDPLVEGGALVTADGKLVGIVVSKGQGQLGGQLGWAVTSEAARTFVTDFQKQQAAERAAKQTQQAVRWVKIAFLAVFVLLMALFGRWFRHWYKRMEAREEAALAAEEAARSEAEEPEAAASAEPAD